MECKNPRSWRLKVAKSFIMSQTYHLNDVEEWRIFFLLLFLKPSSPPPRSLFFFISLFSTAITDDMFAWPGLWLIHSDRFLFLLHVERNRNGVPRWKTLFTNVDSTCPAWSSGLFLLHYMAGNRAWLGLAHVFPPPRRNHFDYCTLFTRWSL